MRDTSIPQVEGSGLEGNARFLIRVRSFPDPNPTLLQRVARGDTAAVQECIDTHGGLVWSLVRRLCPSTADAEDVAQEIFIALWKGAYRYDPALGSEATWVTTVARRKLIDMRRKLGRRATPESVEEGLVSSAPGQAELAERADEAARAARALSGLRSEQRRVLELAVLHGCTYEEIAHRLAMPLGTVKTHARRGLMQVRERLGLEPRPRASGQKGAAT